MATGPTVDLKSLVAAQLSREEAAEEAAAAAASMRKKEGWMVKRGHQRKNWKRRWFVLSELDLAYYTGADKAESKGSIRLKDVKLTKLPAEIRGRQFCFRLDLVDSPPYYCCCESVEDFTSWTELLQAVNGRPTMSPTRASIREGKVLVQLTAEVKGVVGDVREKQVIAQGGAPDGYSDWDRTRQFGVRLIVLMYAERGTLHVLPRVPRLVLPQLLTKHTGEEGLFRLSGSLESITALRARFDTGEIPDLVSTPAHTLTGLLKQYLSALPEPLLTFRLYRRFLTSPRTLDRLLPLVLQLPPAHLSLFAALLRLFSRIVENSGQTKMSAQALATSVAPTLLRERFDSAALLLDVPLMNECVAAMIGMADGILAVVKEREGKRDGGAKSMRRVVKKEGEEKRVATWHMEEGKDEKKEERSISE